MRTIEFEGIKAEYDERCIMSYKWQKAVNSGDSARSTRAIEQLFAGHDEEYADALSDSGDEELDNAMDKMGQLLQAVMEDMGRLAKN